MAAPFIPALIIVDLQEDFCPPSGSLAVPNGRAVIPFINKLLHLPFALKVATKDWHPASHISFASNHVSKQPFSDFTTITHPTDPSQSYSSRLWPAHCIQSTPGASLVPELDVARVDRIIEKGQNERLEMYSAFYDPLKVADSGLLGLLREHQVSDVYVVGLAADYCVRATAEDARKEGFRTWVVEEGTKAVDQNEWEKRGKLELEASGVKVVNFHGEELARVGKV